MNTAKQATWRRNGRNLLRQTDAGQKIAADLHRLVAQACIPDYWSGNLDSEQFVAYREATARGVAESCVEIVRDVFRERERLARHELENDLRRLYRLENGGLEVEE